MKLAICSTTFSGVEGGGGGGKIKRDAMISDYKNGVLRKIDMH